ncbi:MAG: Translation initiation factor 2 subunit gamma [Candidatus Woesearchaeota archaeon]|nr:Translation initiation factor 2 subunit gamma [Candidatus Woesearchaeota archaeon]
MGKQPELNIGTIGHVDHGKTTLVKALTGKWADTHSEEMRRGITIRLGYADGEFRKCPKCKGAKAFTVKEKCPDHEIKTKVLRKVSFVDAPGHESLMATMLSGAKIMDAGLLLIAANEECPQPQTREHIMALQIAGLKNIIVVQNKIDLVNEKQAMKSYKQIKDFLKDTEYKDAPIIPVSAQHNVNIDVLMQMIQETFPTPKRDAKAQPIMFVARSFDVNKPGSDPFKMGGGVLGGVVVEGKLKVKEEIEIKPGRRLEKEGKVSYVPLTSKIVSLMTGGKSTKQVLPGGNIGLQTNLDPSITKSDQLAGSLVGHKGKLPPTWEKLDLDVHLLERVVGTEDELKVIPLKLGEMVMFNVNAAATVGRVSDIGKDEASIDLKRPVCAEKGARVTISRRVANRFRLIGYGIIN